MRRTIVGLAVVALGLALAGCSGEGAPAAQGGTPTPTVAGGQSTVPTPGGGSGPSTGAPPPTGAPPSTATRPNPATAMLVQFDRSGGITGASDIFVVYENGTYTLIRTKPKKVESGGKLSAQELADLRSTLAAADFPHLPKMSPGHGADLYTYGVGYRGIQVSAQDGAVPAKLKPVVSMLGNLMAKHST